MSGLSDLIERLEKLEGPSRDADYRIEKALVHPDKFPDVEMWPPFMVGSKVERSIPSYTASLDAATALVVRVLPGWRIENLCEWDHETLRSRGPWTCDLMRRGKDFSDHFPAKCSHAPTPAIALCLALLRALQQEEKR